jgi:hypothetical protein
MKKPAQLYDAQRLHELVDEAIQRFGYGEAKGLEGLQWLLNEVQRQVPGFEKWVAYERLQNMLIWPPTGGWTGKLPAVVPSA